jgi:hypothetical protein
VTPAEAARRYAELGLPVFPCGSDKTPRTLRGFKDATTDVAVITAWWKRWPDALIGMPTGEPIGLIVIDLDVKNGKDGIARFIELENCPIMPATPAVRTVSGGLHLYYARPDYPLGCSADDRYAPGIDIRATGGYVIVPGSGGYSWEHWHFGNCQPLTAPKWLQPRPVERPIGKPIRPTDGLSRYGERALDKATAAIINAPCGQQEATLNSEAFSIATLAAAGGVPAAVARAALLWAARQMPDYDTRRPWRPDKIEEKVNRAFDDGLRHPREVNHAA